MAKQTSGHKGRGKRLLVSAALVLLTAGFVWWGNTDLLTERFTFASPRLPAPFAGFRIVQLSDLHETEFGKDNGRLFAAVKEENPDIIALTGDLVDRFRGKNLDFVDQVARGLTAIAPTYFVTGNHEWAVGDVPELKERLEAQGVQVLSNDYVPLERDGATIFLAGVDDPNGYADQKSPEEVAAALYAKEGEDAFWLLLAHRNDRFETQYSRLGADLTLSGHGHGGVIRLPFTDGLLSTDRTFFPTCTAGFYTAGDQDAPVFVSRGLGNSGPLLRLFNRPEVAVLTLERP